MNYIRYRFDGTVAEGLTGRVLAGEIRLFSAPDIDGLAATRNSPGVDYPLKMGRQEFLSWEHKSITLLGMSGVGKTTLADKLPKDCWFHYSGDYRIGTKYLQEPILDNIKKQAMQVPYLRELLRNDSIYIASNITTSNLQPISAFLGKIGNPDRGGLPLAEFKKRQRLHHAAEVAAMRDVAQFIEKSADIYEYQNFINDAGGSLCELESPETMELLAELTLIIYLRASEHIENLVIERQQCQPKPMYYQEEFLDQKLAEYLSMHSLADDSEIQPDKFSRWIFPELVAHRRPLYQAIADQYGYTMEAEDVGKIADEREFLERVGACLDAAEAA